MYLRIDQVDAVNWLVCKCHYSHRHIPTMYVVLAVSYHHGGSGFDGTDGPIQSGCLFSKTISRVWEEIVHGRMIELSRLVRRDEYKGPPLSKLVSQGLYHLKKGKLCDIVISYADYTQDHHGGIYQACSWNYSGMRAASVDGFFIGKVFMPRRTLSNKYGTRRLSEIKKRHSSAEITPHMDLGKFLYWKALNKEGEQIAEKLGLQKLPYPKPKEDKDDQP